MLQVAAEKSDYCILQWSGQEVQMVWNRVVTEKVVKSSWILAGRASIICPLIR